MKNERGGLFYPVVDLPWDSEIHKCRVCENLIVLSAKIMSCRKDYIPSNCPLLLGDLCL